MGRIEMSVPEHVVILGGGPAGLAVGHELSANGEKATILERNDFVGGLCRTVHHNGYKFDLGGHRWFTKNERLNDWLRRLMGNEILMVDRTSRIYYEGKFFNYPINVVDILKKTSLFTVLHAGVSLFWAFMRRAILSRPIVNMKDAYVSQFGNKLYDMFFRRYSEKVWGAPCESLSGDWVVQRSKGISIGALVRKTLLGSSRETGVSSLIDQFMYPSNGYVRISERMAE